MPIKKQKNGIYRGKIKIGEDQEGKSVYKWYSGKTKKEFEENKQKVITKYINGGLDGEDTLFGVYCANWYETYKYPHLAPATLRNYRSMLNTHVLPKLGDRRISAIRPSDIQKLLNGVADTAPGAVATTRMLIKECFEAACVDRIIASNPVTHVKTKVNYEKKKKRALTIEERAKIEELCDNEPKALFVALMYYMGLRYGEAVGLEWQDIDFKGGIAHIERDVDVQTDNTDKLKTKASRRDIPIPLPLMRMLRTRRGMPGMRVVGKKAAALRHTWVSLIVDRLGLTNVTPHYLRHNFITMCWEKGIDVYATARYVGHSNVSVTLDIYTHLSEERREEQDKKLRMMWD